MPGKRYDRQFKLSAARLVLEGEIPVKGLSDQLNVPCCTLRRWAAEYEADGEDAFPGSGNPVANKDYEILQREREEKADDAEAAAIRRKRGCK
ncbi:transposase [Senegalimassilia anaerobia]